LKFCPLNTLLRVILIVAAYSSNSYAVETCKTDTSDPDGDGWGWENNMSCRVSGNEPPTWPLCQSNDADPDGDGWGWENDATCRVQGITPGTDFDSAALVQLDTGFSYQSNDNTDHYYKFVVDDLALVSVMLDSDDPFAFEYSIADKDRNEYVSFFSPKDACLAPGTYVFVVSHFTFPPKVENYTATISAADPQDCAAPVLAIDSTDGTWHVGADGHLYQATSENGDYIVNRLNSSGTVLWDVTVADLVSEVHALPDGRVLITTVGDQLYLLDNQGNTLWTYSDSTVVSLALLAFNSNAVAVNDIFDNTIYVIDVSTGSLRWSYDYPNGRSPSAVTITDTGSVYVSYHDEILIFD